ncbi:hypothetical protein HPF18_1266 [Helicobacter pylori]|nr:hypothetical protein [Helicobacter pylori]BAW39990.1 hypothetical protein HPF18_1266 [Helicobacter pylori]
MSKNTIHLTQSLVVGLPKTIKPIRNLNKNARNTIQLKGGIEASFEFMFFLKNEILVILFLQFESYRLTKLFYILVAENTF